MDLATPFLADTPDAARPHPLPRRWHAIPGRRIVKKAILLGFVVGATGVAGLTTEMLRSRPPLVLRPPVVTASPPSPTSADRMDPTSEDNRLVRRLRERANPEDRGAQSPPADSQLVLRAPSPVGPKSVLPPTRADLPPLTLTPTETPEFARRVLAVEPRSTPTPAMRRLDPTAAAGDGWWAEPDSTPGITGCRSPVADCIVSDEQ
jgi:hypothetical protein